MKKAIIIMVLTAAMGVSGVISASAVCMACPNSRCGNAEYCVEECPNNCVPYNYGTNACRGMRHSGRHGGRHCGNNAYCR